MRKLKHLFMLGLFCMISIGASAEVYSGSCGSNAKWSLDTQTGLLSITGSGDMEDYKASSAPWYSHRSNIKSLSVGNQITSIGQYTYYNCLSLKSVTIGNSVASIGKHAFEDCSGLISVIIPDSVISIGEGAFCYCSGLTSVTIPNSVTSIDYRAFRDCSSLTSITIGNFVTSIGQEAFYGCTGLTSVTIPNSVTKIEQFAFSNCSGLTSVTIPNAVTSIGGYAFQNCSGLTSTTIGNSVTSIETGAFQDCSKLTSVTIPNSVISIGGDAFRGCNNVKELIYAEGTKTVLRTYLTSITSVTIPNSVTSIGQEAFAWCSGLTSVTIPNSVTEIGSYAFNGCSGLTSVYVGWKDAVKIPALTSSDFPYSNCDLYVPTGTKTIYQGKDYWSTFKNIYEYELESLLLGDANDDGSVNVNDITTIATYILNGKVAPWNEKNADANEDGSINVNDITATATIILGGEDGDDDSQAYLKCPDNHHPHVIDLGLPSGTKWCCCNVGATTPEGYGGYYAWGETSEKDVYSWDTYVYGSSADNCQNIGSDIAGTEYDVAHVRMSGSWRMPNVDQMKELINNCTRTWTNQNGVNGVLVTGKNGGQIFLPAAGYRWGDGLYYAGSYGFYWSSSLFPDYDFDACNLGFFSGHWLWGYHYYRYYGLSIRAVCP